MGTDDLAYLDLAEAADQIRSGAISPVELTEAILARIHQLNKHLSAFITITDEKALASARAAEQEITRGHYRGPLHGIPVSLKDLIATKGIRTTAGSNVLVDWVPDFDATVWTRLEAAGAVLLGKTNLHEFAQGASLVSDRFGAARNPWDLERTTNGSSSGSGAAVAAGLGYASIGSETGGSIRRPAAYCGLVGFKPTYGLVSRWGVIPAAWTLDHLGPMARSVKDAALVLQAIVGHDPRDPGSSDRTVEDFVRGLDQGINGRRIGVLWPHVTGSVDDEVDRAYREALNVLGRIGAEIVEVEVPDFEYTAVASSTIMAVEASSYHAPQLERTPERYGRALRYRLEQGRHFSSEEYLLAQRARRRLGTRIAEVFRTVDLIASPAMATPASRLVDGGAAARDRVWEIGKHWSNLHRFPTLLGLPAISIPTGVQAGEVKLPIGLQFCGRPFEDAFVLAAAHAYEQVTRTRARPPLHDDMPLPTPVEPTVPDESRFEQDTAELRRTVQRLAELPLAEVEPALVFRVGSPG